MGILIRSAMTPAERKAFEAVQAALYETSTLAEMAYVTSEYLAALSELDEMEV